MCQNIAVRFSEKAKLFFLTSFPDKAFLCLKENYGAFFDCVALKSEILVPFSDPDIAKNSVYDLHQYIVTCTPLIRRVLVRMIGFINSWLHTYS
jgi:hypothetical protein